MKKLISICFLLFFVAIGNAQENKKSKWSELNQDQLNLALTKSKKTIKTGKILTFSGYGLVAIGAGIAWSGQGYSTDNTDDTMAAANNFLRAGGIIMFIGFPVWIVGSTRKNNITLELVKFNPTGSASINGIGLKIRF